MQEWRKRSRCTIRFIEPCPLSRCKRIVYDVSESDSSDDAETDNNVPKTAPRYYPHGLLEAIILTRNPIEPAFKAARVKTRLPFLKPLDGSFLANASSIEEMVEILLAADCSLSDVVCLQNAELTKVFLKKMPWTSKYNFDEQIPWVINIYAVIDADSRYSVDIVMNSLDMQNAQVILTCGPGRYHRKRHFFYNLVSMATERRNLKALKVFVEHIIKWNILDEEGSKVIEQEVFQKADKEVLRIFLQNRLDFHMDHMFGINVVAAMFANPSVKIGALKRKSLFNVNAAGYGRFSALHYAMAKKDFKKIKFLLDRGADPNKLTSRESTPLVLALWELTVNPVANKKCAELLLQYGADPYTISSERIAFYGCMTAKRALAGRKAAIYASVEYLMELSIAYSCIYDVDSAIVICDYHPIVSKLQKEDGINSFSKYQHELQTLKEQKIRGDLTMFTVVSKTGEHLIRLVNEEDQKIITSYLDKYRKDMTINPFYVNAIREHMRQFRMLVARRNRAMLVLSESAKVLAPYFVVLNKIVSYLTDADLLMFQ